MFESSGFVHVPTLSVSDIELPPDLSRLHDLAYNLWWTWNPHARALFRRIDPEAWERYRNPVQLLINVERGQWRPLLRDHSFMQEYRQVVDEFETYRRQYEETWFNRRYGGSDVGHIAYFSMEYGIHEGLAIYSGGLGVLSGDHTKSASDLGLPLVAVGLLYRRGYFRQRVDADGKQQHIYPDYDFSRLPLRPAAAPEGAAESDDGELRIRVPLPGRDVVLRVWVAQVGRVPLLLLDSNLPQNDAGDRPITSILYVRGREMRLVQELVLGVGGVRALAALGIEPTVWHINEGHCALLQLERLRHAVEVEGEPPHAALEALKRDTVFTTHTPVPAGNEQYQRDLVARYMAPWSERVGLSVDELLALGDAGSAGLPGHFNLTAVGLRLSRWANAVSRLNAEVTSRMWGHVVSRPEGEPAIRPITNGIHTPTWGGREMRDLFARWVGEDWRERLLEPAAWQCIHEVPDIELWQAHLAQKRRLGRFLRRRLQNQLARHGGSPDELRAVERLFDPETLTFGFARRFATYKRARLVFSDLERVRRLVADTERPVQFLFAGKAHPADRPGQELIESIFQLGRELPGRVSFIEDYDMEAGRMLVQGVDVWLNTPRRPMEASGTSGQKAAMNGVLNFSILDGWWPEGFDGTNGWAIGSAEASTMPEEEQDAADAVSLYSTLEGELIPAYYERDANGLPLAWLRRMKSSIASLTPGFSSARMVRDYVEQAYLPPGS